MDIHKTEEKSDNLKHNYVFIQTKTNDELRVRLEARGTESEDTLNKRLKNAQSEMDLAQESQLFSKFLIND